MGSQAAGLGTADASLGRVQRDPLPVRRWLVRPLGAGVCPSGGGGKVTVNASFWKRFPLAPRETPFRFQDAVARITEWAAGSVDKFNTAFLWRDPKGAA